ncbi:MAG: hypothetical protein RBT63_03625 [Bdellovibrionales bacterium]|nr:hypothetical protein [Bdellovibrionales bacterium]
MRLKSVLRGLFCVMVGPVIVAAGIFSTGTRAVAQTCESVFLDMTPYKTAAEDAVSTWQRIGTKERLARVLTAIGRNGQPYLAEKSLVQKGELTLGYRFRDHLDRGERVLIDYRFDASREPMVFKMAGIRFLDTAGNERLISDAPLDPATGQLKDEIARLPEIYEVRRQLNLELDAETSRILRDSARWLSVIEAKEFRDLREIESVPLALKKLEAIGRARRLKEFIKRDILKQTFRVAVMGAVVFLSSRWAMESGDEAAIKDPVFLAYFTHRMLAEVMNLERSLVERGLLSPSGFPDEEKARLVLETRSIPNPKGQFEMRFTDVLVSMTEGANGEAFWLMERSSKRVFVGVLEFKGGKKKGIDSLRVSTRYLVEVRSDLMPTIYKSALKLSLEPSLSFSRRLVQENARNRARIGIGNERNEEK